MQIFTLYQLTNESGNSEPIISGSTTPSSKRNKTMSDSLSDQSSSSKKLCLTAKSRDLGDDMVKGSINGSEEDEDVD